MKVTKKSAANKNKTSARKNKTAGKQPQTSALCTHNKNSGTGNKGTGSRGQGAGNGEESEALIASLEAQMASIEAQIAMLKGEGQVQSSESRVQSRDQRLESGEQSNENHSELYTLNSELDGLEVHGDHYVVGDFTKYPDLAYEPYPEGGGRNRWLWDQNRPRFIGEDFYVNGYLPADFAAIGGEDAFSGRTGARKAVGILYRMLTEGYRWNEYAAWQFWLGQDRAVDQYASNAPIAVLCK